MILLVSGRRTLATSEGREGKMNKYACQAPLKGLDSGELVAGPQAKASFLAAHSSDKFGAFPQRTSRGQRRRGGLAAPAIFVRVRGKFDLFSQLEVGRAISGLAKGKAPGPDMFPVEVFRNAPRLLKPLTKFFFA